MCRERADELSDAIADMTAVYCDQQCHDYQQHHADEHIADPKHCRLAFTTEMKARIRNAVANDIMLEATNVQ